MLFLVSYVWLWSGIGSYGQLCPDLAQRIQACLTRTRVRVRVRGRSFLSHSKLLASHANKLISHLKCGRKISSKVKLSDKCSPLLSVVSVVPQRAVFMPSVTIKEGYLHKHKAEGPQLLSRFAFKKRYFWLTSQTLSYAKSPDWQVSTTPSTERYDWTTQR